MELFSKFTTFPGLDYCHVGFLNGWLLGICFLRGVPEDVVVEIGVPVEALAKTGEGDKGGCGGKGEDG